MEDFIIKLRSQVVGLDQERTKIQNFVKEFDKTQVNINVKADTKSVNTGEFTNAGKDAQKQFQKGFESSAKSNPISLTGSNFQKQFLKDLEDTLEKSEKLYRDNQEQFERIDELRGNTHRDSTRAIQAEQRLRVKNADKALQQELKLVEKFAKNKAEYMKQSELGNNKQATQLLIERQQIQKQMRALRSEMKQYEDIYSNKAHKGILRAKVDDSQSIIDGTKAKIQDDRARNKEKEIKDRAKVIIDSEKEIYNAKVKFQRMLNANTNADKQMIGEAKKYYDSLSKVNVSDYKNPQAKSLEVVKKLDTYTTNIVDSNKKNTEIIRQQVAEQRKLESIKNKEQKSYADLKKNESAYLVGLRKDAYQSIGNKSDEMKRMHDYYSALEKESKKYADKIRNDRVSGIYGLREEKYNNFLSQYQGQDSSNLTKLRKQVDLVKTLQQELRTGKYQKGEKQGLNIVPEDQIAKAQKVDKLVKSINNTMRRVKMESSQNLDFGVAEKNVAKVSVYMEKNTKALKKYGKELDIIRQKYSEMKTKAEKKSIDTDFDLLKSKISTEGLTGKSAMDEFKRAFTQIGQFVGIYGLLQNIAIDVPRQLIQAVKDVDEAMTNLKMATGISNEEAKGLMSTYVEMGKELKATATDVAASATEWLKQGKSIAESNQLVKDSIVLSKIGDLSSQDATKTITAAMKSYDLSSSEVMGFVDQISAIDMASATDVGGLADAFNKVAANARNAGVETHKVLSYAATIGETTQQGMDSVGTSLNAIFTRMGNIKLGRLKDPESNEDLSNVELSLRRVGISLRESTGEFREFDDVIDDVASRWGSFNEVTQRAIAQSFAGKVKMLEHTVMCELRFKIKIRM